MGETLKVGQVVCAVVPWPALWQGCLDYEVVGPYRVVSFDAETVCLIQEQPDSHWKNGPAPMRFVEPRDVFTDHGQAVAEAHRRQAEREQREREEGKRPPVEPAAAAEEAGVAQPGEGGGDAEACDS